MSAILEKTYDYNYSTTMYLVTIIGMCDLLLSWFSYYEFGYGYVYAKNDAADAVALAATFDENGCNEYGNDAYGVVCPGIGNFTPEEDNGALEPAAPTLPN